MNRGHHEPCEEKRFDDADMGRENHKTITLNTVTSSHK